MSLEKRTQNLSVYRCTFITYANVLWLDATEHIQFNHRGRVWEIQLRNEQGALVEENDGVRQIRHHYLHMAGFNTGLSTTMNLLLHQKFKFSLQ